MSVSCRKLGGGDGGPVLLDYVCVAQGLACGGGFVHLKDGSLIGRTRQDNVDTSTMPVLLRDTFAVAPEAAWRGHCAPG